MKVGSEITNRRTSCLTVSAPEDAGGCYQIANCMSGDSAATYVDELAAGGPQTPAPVNG